jgi:hypothetical protein
MTVIRVNFLPGFHLGDDAVLLTLDGSGIDKVKNAVEGARSNRSSRFLHNGVAQEFHIEAGAAALGATRDNGRTAGHCYVDMPSPAKTLVISRDEYTDIVYQWVSPE